MMEPSPLIAAKALSLAQIRCTPLFNWPWTLLESPPQFGSPQVITDPPQATAAKA
jgi:hypothetical protein